LYFKFILAKSNHRQPPKTSAAPPAVFSPPDVVAGTRTIPMGIDETRRVVRRKKILAGQHNAGFRRLPIPQNDYTGNGDWK
jgi:hypothetical protein